jgi:hypothetical protein
MSARSMTVKRNRAGQTRWTTDIEVVDLVRALARQMPDQTIAALLNRSGKSTYPIISSKCSQQILGFLHVPVLISERLLLISSVFLFNSAISL